MPIAFAAALRLYAKEKGHFMLPRKGTPEYDAVKKLQAETEDGPEHQIKRKAKKATAVSPVATASAAAGGMGEPPAHVVKTTEIDAPMAVKKGKKVVKDAAAKPPKKEKVLQRDGKTTAEDNLETLAVENTGPSAAVSAQLPGQKTAIEGELKKAKRAPRTKVKADPAEPTVEGMKTDDPKAIEGKAPFSTKALRLKLLA